jgi:hypothetical protein
MIMATNIYGRELPNQTYLGTSWLQGQPGPSNWTYNSGTGSYTIDGKQVGGGTNIFGRTTGENPAPAPAPTSLQTNEAAKQASEAAKQKAQGSMFSLTPEVLKKMWM